MGVGGRQLRRSRMLKQACRDLVQGRGSYAAHGPNYKV